MGVVGRLGGRYDPKKVEAEVLRFWEDNNVYEKVKEANSRFDKFFNFIDGPPYPSSEVPHVGTGWNKVLKDLILRYKRFRGFRVNDRPGYDCHGLPIEVAVEKELGTKCKRDIEERIGVERFIELCKKSVLRNVKSMTYWFKNLGVFMDWSNPYLTLRDEYVEAAWWLIKRASEKGLLSNEERVVYWCPRCSTTLAEYEVEYKELIDPSIYVKFKVKGKEGEYLVIWTTTPWTLPANTFIMAHPEASYVRVKVGNEVLILAESRLNEVLGEAGLSNYELLESVKGKDLEGLEYEHPLEDLIPVQAVLRRYHRVVLSREFVTLNEGTGLVHAAPGHGFEDYLMARRLGIDYISSPVDEEGRFTKEAGRYAGIYVREANDQIIKDLQERDALLYAGRVKHRYPVCWRCKSPVILRAREQWVLKVTKLKDKLASEVRKAEWIPKWALARIMNMIDNLQDWVLSRQRYWGTPLPIWRCPNGHILVIGSSKELVKYGGKIPKELHRPWIDEVVLKCPYCGGDMRRVSDVIDVWFDSGIAFYASVNNGGNLADFITEGHDQTRGWFFSMLRAGVIGFDRVPYRTVLVHGFALDEKGREMHKSLGNYVGTDEVIEKCGRDAFRLAVLQNTVWEDLRFSWKMLEDALRDLSVIWNVYVFASTYMNMDGYDPMAHSVDMLLDKLRFEDRWLLSKFNSLISQVTRALDEYRVHDAVKLLRNFIINDVSHWYIKIIRPRVWIDEETVDKLAAYSTLYYVLMNWLVMASIVTPFITEKIYQEFFRPSSSNYPLSISMLRWPEVRHELIDKNVEEEMNVLRDVFEAAAAARMKVKLKLRQPVRRVIIYTDNESVIKAITKHSDLLKYLLNAKLVEVKKAKEKREVLRYGVRPIYSRIGPKYRELARALIRYVEENQDLLAEELLRKGEAVVVLEGKELRLTSEDVSVIPVEAPGYVLQEVEWGSVALDTNLSEDEIADGLAKDIVRRIQTMRKDLDLPLNAYINVAIKAPEHRRKLLLSRISYITREVRAKEIKIIGREEFPQISGREVLVKEWIINNERYTILISRCS